MGKGDGAKYFFLPKNTFIFGYRVEYEQIKKKPRVGENDIYIYNIHTHTRTGSNQSPPPLSNLIPYTKVLNNHDGSCAPPTV